MSTWLREWYPDRVEDDADYQPMMRNLSRSSGDELARVFLQDMIAHHMMAVIMMSQQFLVRGDPEPGDAGFAQLAAPHRERATAAPTRSRPASACG